MFKWIHGLAPHYLSNDVTMNVDIHGYETRSVEIMDLSRCTKGVYKRSILYKSSSIWNKLPPRVKESTSLNDFKHNFRILNGWIHPSLYFFLYARLYYTLNAIILSILLTGSPIYSYPELISILSWYCCFYAWSIFMNVYIYICFLYLCILLCNGAEWRNSVTEWFTLYEINTLTPGFQIFQSICATPNFKSWIRPCILHWSFHYSSTTN